MGKWTDGSPARWTLGACMVLGTVTACSNQPSAAELAQQVTEAQKQLVVLSTATNAWRAQQEGECPVSIESLRQAKLLPPPNFAADPWGTPYQFECTPTRSSVTSYGPDRVHGSADDLSSAVTYERVLSPGEQFERKLAAATSVSEVTKLVRPLLIADRARGTVILALWAGQKMTWEQLVDLPETDFGESMKDPEANVGMLLCARGMVVEIAKLKADTPTFAGGLLTNKGNVMRFVVVGDTRGIVAESSATLCGVVTGQESYANSGGGTTHAIAVVGMFQRDARR